MGKIKIFKDVSWQLWEDIVRKSSYSTYFHTPFWARLIVETFPKFSIATIGIERADGSVAILPLIEERKGLFGKKRQLKSMEPGVYGGIVAEGELSSEEIEKVFYYLTTLGRQSIRIVDNPFNPFSLPPIYRKRALSTHILDLSLGIEHIWHSFGRGQKSNIRQAQKKGIVVRQALHIDDIEHYYDIYNRAVKDWDLPKGKLYPKKLFINLLNNQDKGIKIWLAEKEKTIIAGIVVLYWNKKMFFWHGCFRRDYSK